ncbi:MAG: lipoate--protein ligase [Anaerolineales bacterium]|nr:lipoate--protein ligase [Anaerolineales bacterium]
MLFVDNQNITDPRRNLALEEFLLRHVQVEEPILLFYINEPSVIMGRNQNSAEEIDPDFIKDNGIHVVRRLSGGGAVYHDLGNLNFSFITNAQEDLHNFAKFTDPVVRVLRELGVQAELRGKSDIFADGKKISGNAQYASGGRMFSHGTLLFDTSIETMLRALNPRQGQIESRAVQSVRSFVTNIRELLLVDNNIYQLRQALLNGIFGAEPIPTYDLSEAEWAQVGQIAAERYETWAWNIGRSPKFNRRKDAQLPVGKIDVRLDVVQGVIEGVKIYGTFFSHRDIFELEKQLVGVRYEREALTAVLDTINLAAYFGDLDKQTFLELLY